MTQLVTTIAVGVIATAAMDLWGVVRRPLLGWPRANYRLIGRWFAYMPRGRFRHAPIASSAPLPAELLVGWTVHYLIGISFAVLLVAIQGTRWLQRPTLGPALLVGGVTLIAPLFVMQPAMGAPRTPRSVLQSLITHTIFGLGLYGAARIISLIH